MAAGLDAGSRLVHGTCVALAGCGVLILGPSGSGKSDLALRLIDQPGRGTGGERLSARLVADDQVRITSRQGRLVATAPPALAGLMEVRGLGIVALDCAAEAELELVVRLAEAKDIERLPERSQCVLFDLAVPEIAIDPRSPSAPARVRAGLLEILRATAEIAT